MKKLIESLLKSTAIFLFAVLGFALPAGATIINVNVGNAGSANALNGTAYSSGGFNQAPVSYLGTTWTDIALTPNYTAVTVGPLPDSQGNVTTVGFATVSPTAMQGPTLFSDHPNVKLLQGGIVRAFNSSSGNNMNKRVQISGLTPGTPYHIIVVGCRNDTAAGEWGIGTTSSGPTAGTTKTIINTLPVHEDWVAGDNYAIFYRVAADSGGNIFLWGKGQPAPGGYANGIVLNGIQIATADEFQSPECDMLSMTAPGGAGVISGTDVTLYVPTGTPVTALVPTITVSSGATVLPASGVANDFTSPQTYTVTAENGTTSKAYTVTVVELDPTGKIYVNMDDIERTGQEGPAGDIGATWNERIGTTAGLSASGLVDSVGFPSSVGYTTTGFDGLDPWGNPALVVLKAGIRQFNSGAVNSQSLTINGLTPGAFYNVWLCDANCSASNQRANGVWATPNTTGTPGDHACSDVLNNVGDTWIEGTNYVYFLKVQADGNGKIVFNGYSIPVISYDVRFPLNGFQVEPYTPSTNCDMQTFGIPGYAGVIDQNAKTITLDVPFGTSLATLAPTFTTSPLATCNQTNGAVPTPNFSAGPVHYIVTADDGVTQKDYTVTVNVLSLSTACDMLTFGIPGSPAVIDQGAQTIALTVPYGTSLATLAPTYTTSPLATCDQPNGGVPTPNFSAGSVHYIVTAQDGTTKKDYTATITVGPAPPGGVTGVALWLDASQLAGLSDDAAVTTWNDMSGRGNNATAGGTPIYKTGVLNGQPVIRFDNASSFTTTNLSSLFPTAATVFVVTTIDNDNAYTLVRAHSVSTDEWWRYDGDGRSYPGVFRGNRLESYCAMPNSGSHVFAVSSSASAWEMSIDGVSQGVAAGNYNAGGPLVIGNGSTGGGLNGDIAEVIIYNRVLTLAEAQQVGASLTLKYSLITSYPIPAQIRTFGIPGSPGVIDQGAKTIAWAVPYGTDVTTLAPTFTLSSGTCDKASGSTQDFTTPQTYTVIDGTTTNVYTVTVTVLSPILFGASGAPVQTFDSAAPLPDEWSTLSVAGGSADVTSDAGLDLMMTGIAASSIATPIPEQVGSGTLGTAYWRSDNLTLGTQPTGNKATLLMAKLLNNSGGTVGGVALTYTLGVELTPGEQISGHRLYWSKTGVAGTWRAVGDFTITDPGTTTVNTTLDPVNWLNGETLFVVWADDNSNVGTDGDFTINDVSFTTLAMPARFLTFGIPGSAGVIDNSAFTISLTVPYGTDLATLAPTYTLFSGTCDKASGSTQDFTTPQTYTVIDGTTTHVYTVTVIVAPPTPWINVNFDNTPQTGLVGPAGGLGDTWNQITSTSGSALVDRTGAATSVGFTSSNMGILGPWGNPPLKMLRNGLANFDGQPGNSQQLVLNSLPYRKYYLYLADANCLVGNQRSHGVWSTPNATTTPGDHDCDDRADNSGSAWVEGKTYVLFANVVPDQNGTITVNGYSIPDAPTYDVRLPLSGFQLADVGAAPVVTPVLGFTQNGNGTFTLDWLPGNLLLEATNVMGPWTTNTTDSSPFTVTPVTTVPQMYYRLQAP